MVSTFEHSLVLGEMRAFGAKQGCPSLRKSTWPDLTCIPLCLSSDLKINHSDRESQQEKEQARVAQTSSGLSSCFANLLICSINGYVDLNDPSLPGWEVERRTDKMRAACTATTKKEGGATPMAHCYPLYGWLPILSRVLFSSAALGLLAPDTALTVISYTFQRIHFLRFSTKQKHPWHGLLRGAVQLGFGGLVANSTNATVLYKGSILRRHGGPRSDARKPPAGHTAAWAAL